MLLVGINEYNNKKNYTTLFSPKDVGVRTYPILITLYFGKSAPPMGIFFFKNGGRAYFL